MKQLEEIEPPSRGSSKSQRYEQYIKYQSMHLKDLMHNVAEFTYVSAQCRIPGLSFTRRSAELKINAVSGSNSRSKACPSE